MLLVSYNIQYGKGIDGKLDLARSMAEIAKADIIALQEVESFWTRSAWVDQPAEIAKHFSRASLRVRRQLRYGCELSRRR